MTSLLIIDDDEALQQLYRKLLRPIAGVSVAYAKSSEEAAARLDERHFDVAVTDLNLGPRGNEGLEILARLRRESPRTTVVIMSTMSDKLTTERCRAADAFVQKNAAFLTTLKATLVRTLSRPAAQLAQ